MIWRTLIVIVAYGLLGVPLTHADTRGTLRLGVLPLELESSADTPLFGGRVVRAIDDYNAAAAARDRMTGGTTARLDASGLGVTETLLVFAPGIELGSGPYFFRLEAPVGVGDEITSVGVGVYPINLQLAVRRDVVVYASAGASMSWLDRPGSGDVGGLVAVRGALGARIARHIVIELGYNAFVLGGSINRGRLAEMTDPATMELVQPEEAIAAGEARGIVDASLGLAF